MIFFRTMRYMQRNLIFFYIPTFPFVSLRFLFFVHTLQALVGFFFNGMESIYFGKWFQCCSLIDISPFKLFSSFIILTIRFVIMLRFYTRCNSLFLFHIIFVVYNIWIKSFLYQIYKKRFFDIFSSIFL